MGTYRLKRKTFTKYDDTDNLKRMKDSDILAERHKKPTTTGTKIATTALGGALVGGAGLGVGLGARAAIKNRSLSAGVRALKRGGKVGLIGGAAVGTALMLHQRGKEKSENEFYNRRLDYAQRQAMRREKADWKANMTQRDGYSY